MRFHTEYQGSSFNELLQVELPQLVPQFASNRTKIDEFLEIPHGTTVLGFKCEGGVLLAGDRLATSGHSVASRDIEKVFATDGYSLMAISGSAGPCIEMAKLLSVELEHYEKIEGEALELEGKANKLSQMIRQNLPAALQGMVVIPLFAGFDRRRGVGRLWKFDVTGGRYEEAEHDATGSGGLVARESLKKGWGPSLGREEAIMVAVEALTAAADEDRATGGVDLQRRIFPIIKIASENGIEDAPEADIEAAYREILSQGTGGAA